MGELLLVSIFINFIQCLLLIKDNPKVLSTEEKLEKSLQLREQAVRLENEYRDEKNKELIENSIMN